MGYTVDRASLSLPCFGSCTPLPQGKTSLLGALDIRSLFANGVQSAALALTAPARAGLAVSRTVPDIRRGSGTPVLTIFRHWFCPKLKLILICSSQNSLPKFAQPLPDAEQSRRPCSNPHSVEASPSSPTSGSVFFRTITRASLRLAKL